MTILIYPSGGMFAVNTVFVIASLDASLTCACTRSQRGAHRYSRGVCDRVRALPMPASFPAPDYPPGGHRIIHLPGRPSLEPEPPTQPRARLCGLLSTAIRREVCNGPSYSKSSALTPNASASFRAVRGDAMRRSSSKSRIESAETPLVAESCRTSIPRSSRTRLRLCSSGTGRRYPLFMGACDDGPSGLGVPLLVTAGLAP